MECTVTHYSFHNGFFFPLLLERWQGKRASTKEELRNWIRCCETHKELIKVFFFKCICKAVSLPLRMGDWLWMSPALQSLRMGINHGGFGVIKERFSKDMRRHSLKKIHKLPARAGEKNVNPITMRHALTLHNC